MSTPPKAFICHASDDKDRFVLGFATRLREKGIDVWLDRWEIKPGDSLIDKIFEEGIRNTDAFIVVLSSVSVFKPWVREEMNTGIVKKIEKSCRVIPVVLDNCDVPEALKHLLWVKIGDVNAYDDELTLVVNTIFGISEKPAIGAPPKHVAVSVVDYMPDLTKADNLVFECLGLRYLKVGNRLFNTAGVFEDLKALNLSDGEIYESIDILEGRGYITTERVTGRQIVAVGMTTPSIDAFLRHQLPDYGQVVMTITAKIVNERVITNSELHQQTGYSLPIVNHVLELFELHSLVKLMKLIGGFKQVISVSPELRRTLQ